LFTLRTHGKDIFDLISYKIKKMKCKIYIYPKRKVEN